MVRILSIGNSFSQDAQRYIHKIAQNEGEEVKCVNLYIGGCSLKTHYINMLDDSCAYGFEFNGEETGLKVSIKQALISDEWDYVTLQQVSSQSPRFETYVPYINKLAEYVRLYSPKSKILLHQTWAYEQGSKRLNEELGYADSRDMLRDIKAACKTAAREVEADGIIPCGDMMMRAAELGIKIHRDTFHADLGVGRYLLGLVWYSVIMGKNAHNPFNAFDVEVNEKDVETVKSLFAD